MLKLKPVLGGITVVVLSIKIVSEYESDPAVFKLSSLSILLKDPFSRLFRGSISCRCAVWNRKFKFCLFIACCMIHFIYN